MQRLHIEVRGVVQGVGFRPFVYRLATELGLNGWVSNSPQGVQIEVEGESAVTDSFLLRLEPESPSLASIQGLEPRTLDPIGYSGFVIRPSSTEGPRRSLILPDLATCPECLAELLEPANRRYRYPFTNCTHCGPRYSIIESLPYDRPNTSMKRFALCSDCRGEYEDPRDRRFHAQPNACPVCGPQLELWDEAGRSGAEREAALQGAAMAIRSGEIVAVKGLGGFHLIVDARNEDAVRRLRRRKHREEKPFAIMAPSMGSLRTLCEVSDLEERLLRSPQSPIVLLDRRDRAQVIAPAVAPGNPNLGAMLPYTPLHYLLLAELEFPVVATSGNRSDEPICIEEVEAVARLAGIADRLLVHNRPIVRHVDDSVARVLLGREMILRRARGYAPLPISLPAPAPHPILAVGAHLKNAVALATGRQAFVSQHIGDLETAEAFAAFRGVATDLAALYDAPPESIVCDSHPDYLSTRYAEASGLPLLHVQHHRAHVFACMAENELRGAVLGVSWDGTGYGEDGVIWGGEFLRADGAVVDRVAHLRPFPLPGGEKAIREPRRAALGLLYTMLGPGVFSREELPPVMAFTVAERKVLRVMLANGVNCPQTTSAGRLFDAVAALLGIRQHVNFEGQAALELEMAAGPPPHSMEDLDRVPKVRTHAQVEAADGAIGYTIALVPSSQGGASVLDWEPLVSAVIEGVLRGDPVGECAARFHDALSEAIVRVARSVGEERVLLTGGCFLNRRLLERSVKRLRAEGFLPYWHQRVPPGDGGIALGQLVAAIGFGETTCSAGS